MRSEGVWRDIGRQIRDVRTRLDMAAREAVRRTPSPFCDQRPDLITPKSPPIRSIKSDGQDQTREGVYYSLILAVDYDPTTLILP
jgi:hypothetical protein